MIEHFGLLGSQATPVKLQKIFGLLIMFVRVTLTKNA
ncbi:MAG TPA: DMT family transporter [Candidatus Limosilactobacillus faecipullorum]|nr:DMT family transporter [Candidatus Limosilactobacillus faecipullorum]